MHLDQVDRETLEAARVICEREAGERTVRLGPGPDVGLLRVAEFAMRSVIEWADGLGSVERTP